MKSEGHALAASAVVRTGGKVNDFVPYTIPEFPFAQFQVDGFTSEFKSLCASCNLRVVDILIATLGSTSADRVVSDLQQVADGSQDATFPIDFNLMMWTVTDQLFREILGDSYKWPDAQTRANTLATLLTKENASNYPNGYAAIPDMQFAALWRVGA